jgi:hypothetical protein
LPKDAIFVLDRLLGPGVEILTGQAIDISGTKMILI